MKNSIRIKKGNFGDKYNVAKTDNGYQYWSVYSGDNLKHAVIILKAFQKIGYDIDNPLNIKI